MQQLQWEIRQSATWLYAKRMTAQQPAYNTICKSVASQMERCNLTQHFVRTLSLPNLQKINAEKNVGKLCVELHLPICMARWVAELHRACCRTANSTMKRRV